MGLGDFVSTVVRGAEAVPNAAEHVVSTSEQVEQYLIGRATAAAKVGATAAESVSLDTAAEGLLSLTRVASALSLLPLAILVHDIFHRMWQATDRLPGPLRLISKAFIAADAPVATMVELAGNLLEQEAGNLFRSHAQVIHGVTSGLPGWAIPAYSKPLPPPKSVVFTSPSPVTQGEIAHLQSEINQIKYALGIEQHSGQVPAQVWSQIHQLEADLNKAINAINYLVTENGALQARQTQVEHELANLAGEVHGVRAVTAGWQDVQADIERDITSLTAQYNHAESQIAQQHRQVTQLAPLGLLLQPGLKGLKTLRQLEDTPCMCPKFLNIPNELGTALALIEFVENG